MEETKVCADCQQTFPINKMGMLVVPYFSIHSTLCERCNVPLHIDAIEDGRMSFHCPSHTLFGSVSVLHGTSIKYCPACHEERRKNNRQSRPLCPMCNAPTRVQSFLREYEGFRLDLIKVCCKQCIPQFNELPRTEQLASLRRAMVKAYGETAVIYALMYVGEFYLPNHIGRTKRLSRRMQDYKNYWYKEIAEWHVLEEVSFGPLSMERESRWILHAFKNAWPIDNFEIHIEPSHTHNDSDITDEQLTERRISEQKYKDELTAGVANIEPLTAPYEVVRPLIRSMLNTCDADIVHWFTEETRGMLLP
jgi:hypothetical protein